MTINKSQGQSLNKIGVYLPQPVFSHGQLYVALSQATSPTALKVYIEPEHDTPPNITKNIVKSSMASQRISELTPEARTEPLEVRVIRKWNPFRGRELSFVFVDRYGDAVEAICDTRSKSYFESTIKLNNCYTITDYVCTRAKKTFRVIDRDACIMFGRASTVTLIQNEEISKTFFSFADYSALQRRKEEGNIVLTDFIGRIIDISDIPNKSPSKLLRIKVQHESGKIIDLALWEETAKHFNQEVAKRCQEPVILAVTSTKVTEFQEGLQLTSTSATVTYINPDIPNLQALINRFISLPKTSPPSPPHYSEPATKNIIPVAEALYLLLDAKTKRTCICSAIIVEIKVGGDQAWFYTACSKCSIKTHLSHGKNICLEHGEIHSPTYRYRFSAEIADDSCQATAIFFNQVITSMLNMSCYDFVVTHSNLDRYQLPESLHKLQGKPYLLELQQKNEGYDTTLSVARIFQATSDGETTSFNALDPSPSAAPPLTPSVKTPKRNREYGNETPPSKHKPKTD